MTQDLSQLKVRLVQMTSVDEPATNIQFIADELSKAEKQNLDLIIFPENSLYFRIKGSDTPQFHDLSEDFWGSWTAWSQKHSCGVILGGTPIGGPEGQVTNAMVLVDGTGPKVIYEKIHLFDVDVEGQKPVRESDQYAHGKGPGVLTWKSWKIGLSICYDLRFPELYLNYVKSGVDAVLVPSAFLVPTGQAHWHVLLRARAIENQCYVLAPAQSGRHVSGDFERHTYGHSLAVDPWGQILGECEADGPSSMDVTLKRGVLDKVRRQIPMAKHRKLSYHLGS